jgi:bifunctional non-homologous end joining protein LigD
LPRATTSARRRFRGSRSHEATDILTTCLVDLLSLNGEDFRQRPIEERRAALSPLVAGVDNILFSDALVAEGALVFAKACEMGLEGIVSKRRQPIFKRKQPAMAEVEEPGV